MITYGAVEQFLGLVAHGCRIVKSRSFAPSCALREVSFYRGCICGMDLHSPINLIGMDGIIVRRKCRRAIELDL